uniref:hypothetical protein n=1 Tax=Clostridium sp. NkU-1 TaxID=1095009 RepID=UPI0006D1634F
MSNIIKAMQMADRVLEYGFTREFENIRVNETENPERESEREDSANQGYDRYLHTTELYEDAIKKSQVILDQAKADSEDILNQAKSDGEKLRAQLWKKGARPDMTRDMRTALEKPMKHIKRFLRRARKNSWRS